MNINTEKCVGCGRCTAYCPTQALHVEEKKCVCDLERCTECENCIRAHACLLGALEPAQLEWPREFRALMSNPKKSFKGVQGRGTEEMKTNDVTDRYKEGYIGLALEFGRPSVGAKVRDIQYVAQRLAEHKVEFEKMNPINSMIDPETGNMPADILDEFIISGILEIIIPIEKTEEILKVILDSAGHIDTVFSLDMVSRVDAQDRIPALEILDNMHLPYRANCKTNVGLGRL